MNGDGQIAHHLIDPSRGARTSTQATVIADDVVTADVLAKTWRCGRG